MKTAISIEDELLIEADRTAHQMGISRSRLFSLALANYLRKRRNKEILDQLIGSTPKNPARRSGERWKV